MNYDIVVVGGGPAGIAAAISAARLNVTVLLIEEDALLGGAITDYGIQLFCGITDDKLFAEFSRRLADYDNWYANKKEDPLRSKTFSIGNFIKTIDDMITPEKNLKVQTNTKFFSAEENKTQNDNTKLSKIKIITNNSDIPSEEEINGGIFIDCTGDGVLAAATGCPYMFGRESQSEFNEKHALENADNKVQQLTWMYTLAKVRETDYEPPGYDLSSPNQKLKWGCSINCKDPNDVKELNQAQQKAIKKMKKDWDKYSQKGWEVTSIAPKLGIRESRRIKGRYILNENDFLEGRSYKDTVVKGNFILDPWEQDRENPMYPVENYEIPLRSLLPLDVENMIVAGRCISGTHVAMSSYRVVPIAFATGHAAGTTAALAVKNNCNPEQVDIEELQEQLGI